MITRKRIERELKALGKKVEAAWKDREKNPAGHDESFICSGIGYVTICTSTAVYLAAKLGGEVFGYRIEDNPGAVIGGAEGGHDFVVVDGRYLVDFWALDTYQQKALYDMRDEIEGAEVARLYGDPSKWVSMGKENFDVWREEQRSTYI